MITCLQLAEGQHCSPLVLGCYRAKSEKTFISKLTKKLWGSVRHLTYLEGESDAAIKLLPCDHEVMRVLETTSCRNIWKDCVHKIQSCRIPPRTRRKRELYVSGCTFEGEPWYSDKAIALWPWGHGFKYSKQPFAEMQGKAVYIRSKGLDPTQVGATCTGLPFSKTWGLWTKLIVPKSIHSTSSIIIYTIQ
jgi:hypothetical protein